MPITHPFVSGIADGADTSLVRPSNWNADHTIAGEGARVYKSSLQTISDATPTAIQFDSERYDTDAIHSNTTNNTRLTCKTAGKYSISASIRFAANATGYRGILFRLNGVADQYIAINKTMNLGSGFETDMICHTIYDLAVNDYVECLVEQRSGGDLNVTVQANWSPEFMMQRVG